MNNDDRSNQSGGGQKIPDGVLNAMSKPGQAKPFSYGIDLDELKLKTQRRAPPVAPKKKKPVESNQGQGQNPQMAVPTGPGTAVFSHAQYNSPLSMYSNDNVAESFKGQSGGVITGVGGLPNKPKKEFSDSPTYRFLQENEGRKLPEPVQYEEAPVKFNVGSNPNKQSKSFKVLQWMTDTEKDEQGPVEEDKPRRQRNPLLRHNSEDDEMRFSGLNNDTDIPSRSFQKLHKYAAKNGTDSQGGSEEDQSVTEQQPERVGNYDETSIRYKGKHIPSPSFRVLKSWAELDTQVEQMPVRSAKKEEDEDDGLPETLNPDEIRDVRYKGGHIPSRVFKSLQRAVGDDTPENPNDPPLQNNHSQSQSQGSSRPKIKIITQPAPAVSGATDF